jgi:hypothetical protein
MQAVPHMGAGNRIIIKFEAITIQTLQLFFLESSLAQSMPEDLLSLLFSMQIHGLWSIVKMTQFLTCHKYGCAVSML